MVEKHGNIPELDNYVQGDPIPAPEAIETNTETAWALFSELSAIGDMRFVDTVNGASADSKAARHPGGDSAQASRGADGGAVESILSTANIHGRLYPARWAWEDLVVRLTAQARARGSAAPMPLLPQQALPPGSDLAWKMCFRGHLEWAATHGCMPLVREFLDGLQEQDWEHRVPRS